VAFKDKDCRNHPGHPALSICHSCGELLCEGCLVAGQQYYFCRTAACQKQMAVEPPPEPPAVEPLLKESTVLRLFSALGHFLLGRAR
jgi:hypothetical protein